MNIKRHSKQIDLREFNRDISWRIDIASKQQRIAEKLSPNRAEIFGCPICRSKESTHFVTVYDYPYHECSVCGHLYSKSPPSPEALAALYTEDANGIVLSAQSEIYIQKDLFQKRVDKIAFPKAQFATDLIGNTGKWIDIGAGVGDLVMAAQSLGWNAVGYESDSQEVQFAQHMGANVENLFLDEKNINVLKEARIVSTINVLEHISDPSTLVQSISKNITIGAYFLFEVPRFPSLSAFTNRCFPELAARNIYAPDHLHLFTDKSAEIMLESAGFETVASWFFGQDIYELFGNCMAKGKFSDHPLIDSALSLTNALQEIVDQSGLSDTMLILACRTN